MKTKFTSFFLLAFILSLAFSRVSYSEERLLGQITSYTGDVDIRRAKEIAWVRADLNMPVYFGDHIKTGPAGKVMVTFIDKSLMEIKPGTHVALNTIISPLENKNSVLLFFGRIWGKVRKKLVEMRDYEVQTPTVVIGVRGTEFEVASYEDGTAAAKVESGEVLMESEADRNVLSSNQGARLSFADEKITILSDFRPEWEADETRARTNLFADGRKYGGFVHSEIYKQKDNLKVLVEEVHSLKDKRVKYLSQAKEAQNSGDQIGYESYMSEAKKINREIADLNKKIAFSGRRLECQFGLFSHYGYLAKHPELSRKFNGKEFILAQLDNIEMIQAEFDAMIEEGMKLSMEDMEDLMDEMKEKVKKFQKNGDKKGIFDEF